MNKDMIEKRLLILNDLQGELNGLKEQYNDMLENDAQFQQVQEELTKIKTEAKEKQEKLLSNGVSKAIVEQMKEKRQEIKENKEILSQELVDYYKESGSMEIEDADGNVKRLKFNVTLVN
jgi:hypothetical protein